MAGVFYWFTRVANRKLCSIDPATGEKLTEKNKKFGLRKGLELPWIFWCIQAFSLLETSTAIMLLQNATELTEERFGTDSVTASWYSTTLQYAGQYLIQSQYSIADWNRLLRRPLPGFFHRHSATVSPYVSYFGYYAIDITNLHKVAFSRIGVFISMYFVNQARTFSGTAAAFGVYVFTYSFGPTTIIDDIRTSMWHSPVFGSAYALKITMNNA